MKHSSYTTHEVAGLCEVTIPGVIRWIKEGKLRAWRTPGGHRRIEPDDLLNFLKKYGMPMPAQLSKGGVKKILVVDDDEKLNRAICRLLQKIDPGLRIESAADGFEAGQKSFELKPDLVILDLMLPGMDGFKVCENLKNEKRTKKPMVLAITGFDNEETRTKIFACGADEYLPKPFDLKTFAKVISRLLHITAAQKRPA